MSTSIKESDPEIPSTITNPNTGITYTKGRFFGKGGFAKCYEITDMKTGKSYAGKIVAKKLLLKNNQKEKMLQEIEIHRSLQNQFVVEFVGFFEDKNFVYIVLELCKRRSMMELHRRRKALTEPEVRYYMRQILLGVLYVHETGVIHRDLKLGNLFLNDDLEVKIGDFGLATRIEYNGQRKKTLCGTPNYIAPEILNKRGHSFEVDVWSIGCIMYTLLVGKPPFETNTLKETYNRIKRCDYKIPSQLHQSNFAVDMINSMLQSEPTSRPTVKDLLNHSFFSAGYLPHSLPASSLAVAPRFDLITKEMVKKSPGLRRPLLEINCDQSPVVKDKAVRRNPGNFPNQGLARPVVNVKEERDLHMKTVIRLLRDLMEVSFPILPDNHIALEEMSDPAAQPCYWISKWVDYSDKYGFGYQLNDDSVGVMFNDQTKIVLLADQKIEQKHKKHRYNDNWKKRRLDTNCLINVHYFENDGTEAYFTIDTIPNRLEKKKKLLIYFTRYMSENLLKTGGSVPQRDSDRLSRIPYVNFWRRSVHAVIMSLTDGTIQMNFMDHAKIIFCPLMEAVTYIDPGKNFRTYRLETISKKGCTNGLNNCLKYANTKLSKQLAFT